MGIDEVSLEDKAAKPSLNWDKFLEKNKWSLALGMIGLTLICSGFYQYAKASKEETLVEIIPAQEESSKEPIWVDIEGAIQNPGLYQLPPKSRVNDLLIACGGLSATADRDWVERSVNLAQILSDGVKIYIPRQGEAEQNNTPNSTKKNIAGVATSETININTATINQLDTLWGIGEKRAQDIIDNRPYNSQEELKTKKVIPDNVYEEIKNKISAY